MSNDIDNIAGGIQNAHEVWASPIEVGIALYLLQRQVLWAATMPAVISLLIFYFTGWIAKSAPGRQKVWMQAVQERVAFTSSYLDVCKNTRMLGLSDKIASVLQRLRRDELNLQKKFRHLMVKMNLLGKSSCGMYAILANDSRLQLVQRRVLAPFLPSASTPGSH